MNSSNPKFSQKLFSQAFECGNNELFTAVLAVIGKTWDSEYTERFIEKFIQSNKNTLIGSESILTMMRLVDDQKLIFDKSCHLKLQLLLLTITSGRCDVLIDVLRSLCSTPAPVISHAGDWLFYHSREWRQLIKALAASDNNPNMIRKALALISNQIYFPNGISRLWWTEFFNWLIKNGPCTFVTDTLKIFSPHLFKAFGGRDRFCYDLPNFAFDHTNVAGVVGLFKWIEETDPSGLWLSIDSVFRQMERERDYVELSEMIPLINKMFPKGLLRYLNLKDISPAIKAFILLFQESSQKGNLLISALDQGAYYIALHIIERLKELPNEILEDILHRTDEAGRTVLEIIQDDEIYNNADDRTKAIIDKMRDPLPFVLDGNYSRLSNRYPDDLFYRPFAANQTTKDPLIDMLRRGYLDKLSFYYDRALSIIQNLLKSPLIMLDGLLYRPDKTGRTVWEIIQDNEIYDNASDETKAAIDMIREAVADYEPPEADDSIPRNVM